MRYKDNFRGDGHEKFLNLIVVMVSEMSMCVKTYQIVCLKYMQLIVWQLHFNQVATKINKEMDKEGKKDKGL